MVPDLLRASRQQVANAEVDTYPLGNFASSDDVNDSGPWLTHSTSFVMASDYPGDSWMYRAIARDSTSYSGFHRADLPNVFDGVSTYVITITANQRQGTSGALLFRKENSSSSLAPNIISGSSVTGLDGSPGWNEYSITVDSSLDGGITGLRIMVSTTAAIPGNNDGVIDPGEQATDVARIKIIKSS